jgi:CheY-like chemotaxis protein
VLVVDDGPENRELVRVVLEECGLQVEEADDGLMGMGMALAGDFDAVLMDIQMPRMDGLTATRHLRQQGYRRPVIALTAHAMKGFEEEIKQAGYDRWLVKPIDIEGMLATLAEILGGQRMDASVASPAKVPEARDAPAVQDAPAVPVGAPIVSRYADKPRLHAAVRKFAERLPAQLAALVAACEASDFEAVANLAHGLKGAGGTVGFDEFTEPAIEIERAARAGLKSAIGPALERVQDLAARIAVPGEPAAISTREAA